MPHRQALILFAVVSLSVAGLGIVIGTQIRPERQQATPDAGHAGSTGARKSAPAQLAAVQPGSKSPPAEPPRGAQAQTADVEHDVVHDDAQATPVVDAQSTTRPAGVGDAIALTVDKPPAEVPAQPASAEPVPQIDPDLVLVSRSALAKASLIAKENAAISTLRWIASAQSIVQSSGIIDVDGDGIGEYAYFGELAGGVPCRASKGGAPELLQPAILDRAFGEISGSGNLLRTGYAFRMYLPGASANGKTPGLPEAAGGGAGNGARPDPDQSEILWAVYAWPIELGASGVRAFFLDQEGEILVTSNEDGSYSGEKRAPAFDAAFDRARSADMAAPATSAGAKAVDGHVWTALDLTDTLFDLPVELGPATQADLDKGPEGDPEKVVIRRSVLLRANMSVNEAEAFSSLRAISDAQWELQAAGVIDTDDDAKGEYGYFGELAGAVPCRTSAGGKPERLEPALLGPSYGRVTSAGNVLRNGYVFRMVLPGTTRTGKQPGLAEAPGGGSAPDARPGHDGCEVRWAVYAWPIEAGKTGRLAYFCNQDGELLVTPNADGAYSGEEHAPAFDAAFSSSRPGDLSAPLPRPGAKGNDGHAWAPFGG